MTIIATRQIKTVKIPLKGNIAYFAYSFRFKRATDFILDHSVLEMKI